MMLIKAHAGGGVYELYEAHSNLRYLQSHNLVEVTGKDPDYIEDDRFPWGAITHVTHLFDAPRDVRFVRWVSWEDASGTVHRLITDGPVYICNDQGKTVDALR